MRHIEVAPIIHYEISQKYNIKDKKVIIVPQLGFIPLLQYKLTF